MMRSTESPGSTFLVLVPKASIVLSNPRFPEGLKLIVFSDSRIPVSILHTMISPSSRAIAVLDEAS